MTDTRVTRVVALVLTAPPVVETRVTQAVRMVLHAPYVPPSENAHRHWRVFIHRGNNNTYTGITEIEMRSSAGGVDLTGGGTASAATPIQSGSADAVFDNSVSTQIQWSGSGTGRWVAYDFGPGIEHEIVELVMYTNKDLAARGPRDWSLQYSDDGVTWFESGFVCHYTPWVVGTPVTFTKPTATLQPRARIRWGTSDEGGSGSDWGAGSCAELEFRAAIGGPDQATGGTPSASSTYGASYSADKAFDGNAATLWSGIDGVLPAEWLQYEFPTPVDVKEVVFTARNDGSANQSPRTGRLEVSLDGMAWLTVAEFSVDAWSAGETKTLVSIGDAVTAAEVTVFINRYRVSAAPVLGNYYLTESGDKFITESGDSFIQE